MPSGKTHDVITILLAVPTFVGAWFVTRNIALSIVVTAAMLFGGLMFGPDLDIQSKQYTRWGIFRLLWFPYKVIFPHRSRFTHGIILGTFIRCVYFALMITLIMTAILYARAAYTGGTPPGINDVIQAWLSVDKFVRDVIGAHTALATFIGLWWGAASHTFTDVGISILKKASEIF
jgi:uncharacterized metal-binding protein